MSLHVGVFVFQDDASAFYRLTEPARVLRGQGADVEVFRVGEDPRDCDVVVANRPVFARQADFLVRMAGQGRRVVIDVDDSYAHLATSHGAFEVLDATHLDRACKVASRVVTTTPALLDVHGHGRGTVVPNFVPQRYLDIDDPRKHTQPWVGWSGSLTAHPEDLRVSQGKIARALAEVPGSEFAFIGPKEQGPQLRQHLGHKGPLQLGGFYTLETYPHALAQLDVGVVPLTDTVFNSCKSALKGLEMASVAVPFVASPTADYRRVHEAGLGFLAPYPNDWHRAVKHLLTDEAYRTEMSQAGRDIVRERFTLESNVDRFWDAWVGRV